MSLTKSRRAILRSMILGISATLVACVMPPQPQSQPTLTAMPDIADAPVAAPEEAQTIRVLYKEDYYPGLNVWFTDSLIAWADQAGYALDLATMRAFAGQGPPAEKLAAAAASGTPPDLISHDMDLDALIQNEALSVVTPLLEDVAAKWGSPAARQRNDLYVDGQWWGIPFFVRSDGGWFQRSIWEDAGIDIHGVRQYVDLWDVCLAVSRPEEGIYGWGTTINRCGDADWFRKRVMHGWGAYVQDESGEMVTFNSPEMVEAMTFMTRLYEDERYEPMLPPDIMAWQDSSNNEAYQAGKLAYTQNGGTVYAKLVRDSSPLAEGTGFHAPCGGPVNEEFNSLNSSNWLIPAGANNALGAREAILHFVLDGERMEAVFSHAPAYCLPAYDGLWRESAFIQGHATAREMEGVATDPEGVIPGQYPGPAHNPAMSAASSAGIEHEMVVSILKGVSVQEAVADCHDAYVRIFQEHGLAGAN